MHNRIMRKQKSYYDDLWLKREKEITSYDIGWNYEKRRIDTVILRLLEKLLATQAQIKILEVGIGKGDLALKIQQRFGKAQMTFVGIDLSEQGVRIASSKISSPDFEFLVGDATHLSFNRETIDMVICSEVIEHITNREKLLHLISWVLRRGGLLILTTPNSNAAVYLIPKLQRRISNRYKFGSPQPLNELIDSSRLELLLKRAGFQTLSRGGLVLSFYSTNFIERRAVKFTLPVRRIFEYLENKQPFVNLTLYQLVLARKSK